MNLKSLLLLMILIYSLSSTVKADEWTQDAHDAQRTGFTSEDPLTPWTLAWKFNGPDSQGKVSCSNNPTTGHCYNAPPEAKTISGSNYIFVPAGGQGLYALNKSNGSIAWQATNTNFSSTPVYDSGYVYAAGTNGVVYKFAASTGQLSGSFTTSGQISKALLFAQGAIFALTNSSQLYKINTSNMTQAWVYSAPGNPVVGTSAAYSPSRDIIIFASNDLYVHGVTNSNGSAKWRVKPSPNSPGYPNEFSYGYPVVAEQHGLVFVRMNIGIVGIMDAGTWPNTSTEVRTKLNSLPQFKNLFPLSLDSGQEVFTTAVGPGGTENLDGSSNTGTNTVMQAMPVVKILPNGKEVAYVQWRSGQVSTALNADGRWNANIGEMVLDNSTVPNLQAGDIRFIQFDNSSVHIADEETPLTMAGNTLLYAHWSASQSTRITDRSDSLGLNYSSPIRSSVNPVVGRSTMCSCPGGFPSNHYASSCPVVYNHGPDGACSGRWYGYNNFFAYYGVIDPPVRLSNSYSEGILPRYTYVASGLMVVEGSGGDLLVFRHSGTNSTPPPSPTPPPPGGVLEGDADGNGSINFSDALFTLQNYLNSALPAKSDQNNDHQVNILDTVYVLIHL